MAQRIMHRCEHCGGIQWKRNPRLKRVYDLFEGDEELTSTDVGGRLGITVPNASNALNTLQQEELLVSRMSTHPTGGRQKVFRLPTEQV